MALWNLYQELEIRQTKASARASDEGHTSRIARTQQNVEKVEDRFEKLLMVTEAVWELASQRLGITEAELIEKIQEIDARSGAVDGRRFVDVSRYDLESRQDQQRHEWGRFPDIDRDDRRQRGRGVGEPGNFVVEDVEPVDE